MKAEQVEAIIRAALRGEREQVLSLARQIEAAETAAGRFGVSDKIRRAIQSCDRGQLIPLPNVSQRGILFAEPRRSLDSIVLQDSVAMTIGAMIAEWKFSAELAEYGLDPRNRLLMSGPSGNGKTSLAEAIAFELGLPFAVVAYSELIDSHLGGSSKEIAKVFDFVNSRPCVLFFDEADTVMSSRDVGDSSAAKESNRIVNELLMQADRLSPQSVLIVASNMPDLLDSAMKRRLQAEVHLGSPTPDDLVRLVERMKARNPRLPLEGFDVRGLGAKSFAECEQMALAHARAWVIAKSKVASERRGA